jgi:hypothetical protein
MAMILDLGQSLASFELVRVAAAYSNAVLVAVMPYISDVAQKLDLPVPHPVTVEQVTHCSVLPNRRVEATIQIKGGWAFAFKWGYIETIQGPHDFFTIQDFDRTPEFFGEVKMSKREAIQFARNTITKLGIPLEAVFAEQEPRVTEPPKVGTNTVPHYRIEWLDPRGAGATTSVDMDINGNTKRMERLVLRNTSLERATPKLTVVPPREPNQPTWPLVNAEYAQSLIPIALGAVDEYAEKLSLPVPRPLTTNHVARFSIADNGGWPHCEIELTNGWRFIYRNSMVNGYYAPDNLFNSDKRPILIKEFTGKWNITEAEAIGLVRRTLDKLKYPTNLVHLEVVPQVNKPAVPGIPRYMFYWYYNQNDDLQSTVWAEVDADKRVLKSFYYDDKAYWNHPPPIGVPITLPPPQRTNAASSKTARDPHGPSKPLPRPFTPFNPPTNAPPTASVIKLSGAGRQLIPKEGLELLENGQQFTLLSLEPAPWKKSTNSFHGYPILGQVQIKDVNERRTILNALYAGVSMDGLQALCFDPRHGIHAQTGNQVEDLLICFECGQVYFHGVSEGKLSVSGTPAASLNRILSAAHVPISQ